MNRTLLLILVLITTGACAVEGASPPEGATRLERSQSRVSAAGFSAMLLATPDLDWKSKWATPPETVPHFNEATTVKLGERLFILTFITNPLPDRDQRVDVVCALQVTRPDGSRAVDEHDIPCLQGQLQGDLRNVRLSPAVVEVVAEESDPRGEWAVRAEVTDRVRGVTLTLVRRFMLTE